MSGRSAALFPDDRALRYVCSSPGRKGAPQPGDGRCRFGRRTPRSRRTPQSPSRSPRSAASPCGRRASLGKPCPTSKGVSSRTTSTWCNGPRTSSSGSSSSPSTGRHGSASAGRIATRNRLARPPRVWETWKETTEIFLPDGARPSDWNSPEPVPEACEGHAHARVLFRKLKVDDVVDNRVQPTAADGTLPPTLTDQRGNLVLYEIRSDPRPLRLRPHKLPLRRAKRQAAAKSIQVPEGAMLVKAAWREITAEEEPRFHTIEACIADSKDLARAKYRMRKMGLVGWHLMCKTPSAPSWIWSTSATTTRKAQMLLQPLSFSVFVHSLNGVLFVSLW